MGFLFIHLFVKSEDVAEKHYAGVSMQTQMGIANDYANGLNAVLSVIWFAENFMILENSHFVIIILGSRLMVGQRILVP